MGVYNFDSLANHVDHTIQCIQFDAGNFAIICDDCCDVMIVEGDEQEEEAG